MRNGRGLLRYARSLRVARQDAKPGGAVTLLHRTYLYEYHDR